MNVVVAKTETGRALSNAFAVARGRLPGAGRVADARKQAFEAYERLGLPHRRIEDWKYTDLRRRLPEVLPLADAPDQAALTRAKAALAGHAMAGATRLVLVDGVYSPELSDTAGLDTAVRIQTVRDVLEDAGNKARTDLFNVNVGDNAMVSLNAAMMTDGGLVTIGEQRVATKPIQLVHVATRSAAATYTRSFLKLGKGARATLVENFAGAEGAKAYQANDAVIVWVGEGAEL